MAPVPLVPVWENAPTPDAARGVWIFSLVLMAVLGACAYGIATLVSADTSWMPALVAALFLGPGTLLVERLLSKDASNALAAVEAIGLARLEQRSLAIVAEAAPLWTEAFVDKEPLDVSLFWEDAPTGMAVSRILIKDGTGKKDHSLTTDSDRLYGLRLLPWPKGATPIALGAFYEDYGGYQPKHLVVSVHLPPLTAHNRMALARAAKPGLDAYRAEMAVHRPDADDALPS